MGALGLHPPQQIPGTYIRNAQSTCNRISRLVLGFVEIPIYKKEKKKRKKKKKKKKKLRTPTNYFQNKKLLDTFTISINKQTNKQLSINMLQGIRSIGN